MPRFLFQIYTSTLSIFMGVLITYADFGDMGRFLNLFWSTLYGIPLLILEEITENRRILVGVGGLISPAILTIVIFLLSGKFWDRQTKAGRRSAIGVFFLSGLIVVRFSSSGSPPLDWLPTYWKLMFIAW